MKLLLIAAMTYGALGATCTASQSASDNTADAATYYCVTGKGTVGGTAKATSPAVTGTCTCTCNVGQFVAGCNSACAAPASATCATPGVAATDGCVGGDANKKVLSTVTTDPKLVCKTAADGNFLNADGTTTACTALDPAIAGSKVTCSSATTSVLAGCDTGYDYTQAANKVDAVTRDCTATAACTAGDAGCVAGSAEVPAVVGACTACAGNQDGCATDKSTDTTCAGTTGKLKCTETNTGYQIDANGVVSACTGTNVATWKAAASPWNTCEALTCNAGWTKSGTGTSTVCTTPNACTAGAVPAGYTATGLPVVATADAVTGNGATAANPDACPPVTAVAAVAAVAARATALLAKDATKVADLGTVACDTGYTGTAAATCPVADAAFVYAGCTKATGPASVAQTMIAFVLTVVAMYL